MRWRRNLSLRGLAIGLLALVIGCGGGGGGNSGGGNGRFRSNVFVAGVSQPTAMAFAPDGRLFICEQIGALKVFRVGQTTGSTALSLVVYSEFECGLLGIAFDPAFTTNRYVYLYYTATNGSFIPSAGPSNRVSRFVMNGDLVV